MWEQEERRRLWLVRSQCVWALLRAYCVPVPGHVMYLTSQMRKVRPTEIRWHVRLARGRVRI